MSRPQKERTVCLETSRIKDFAPIWFIKSDNDINNKIESVDIFCDELEAMKLVNIDEMCMKTGWEKMWVSSATFNRIVNSAYKKVTDAIVNGKVLAVKQSE